jgi:hypothetical protein
MSTATDYTPTGLRLEGQYENDRNAESRDLFKAVIREAYGVQDVIVAHHLTYVKSEKRVDGFDYEIVEEIPSADALIFDHAVAKKIFGDRYLAVLVKLAMEPCETRDKLYAGFYSNRPKS